ncbi:MAG: type II secretion system major pseudopilin GspG [Planctomycetota bacterium]
MRIQRNKRSGFTLLELLLVMAILVVLASLSTFAVLNLQKTSYQRTAFMDIKTLSDACKMYKLNCGFFPAKLEDLTNNPAGLSRAQWGGPYIEQVISNDPWNRPYKYSPDEANDRVLITSAGPDGQEGTQDDVPDPTGQQN